MITRPRALLVGLVLAGLLLTSAAIAAWKFHHPQVAGLQTFTTDVVSEVNFTKYGDVCNGDSAFDSEFVQDKGHNPLTWAVLKQVEPILPLKEGSPTVLGVEANGRFYIVHTFNVLLGSPTDHTHYEINECASREDALWALGMLINPDLGNHIEIDVTVNWGDN